MKVNWINLMVVAVIIVLLPACTSTTKQPKSGFLESYRGFVDSTEFDNSKTFSSDDFDKSYLADVTGFQILPFEIWLNKSSAEQFNPSQLAALSQYFHQSMVAKFKAQGLPVVLKPSEKTLTIRGAFTGIKFNDPELSPTDFIPFRILINAGNAAYLEVTDKKDVITEVSLEMEFVASQSQERKFALMATKYLDDTVANNGVENIKAVKNLLDEWVDNFVEQIVKARQ